MGLEALVNEPTCKTSFERKRKECEGLLRKLKKEKPKPKK